MPFRDGYEGELGTGAGHLDQSRCSSVKQSVEDLTDADVVIACDLLDGQMSGDARDAVCQRPVAAASDAFAPLARRIDQMRIPGQVGAGAGGAGSEERCLNGRFGEMHLSCFPR